MSRQRLRFVRGQRVEVVETLIGRRENLEIVQSLPFIRSQNEPKIQMSVRRFVPRSRFHLTRTRSATPSEGEAELK
jgi:hypothetical protein